MITNKRIKQIQIINSFCLTMIVFNGCLEQHQELLFLDRFENEDFSQFNNVCVFIRDEDRVKNIIYVDAPHLVRDTSDVGCYVVELDREDNQVIDAGWMTDYSVEADTLKLQQLVQAFMEYNIPRLSVDEQGNVFVYLSDVEKLALVRFANVCEIEKEKRKYDKIGPHEWKRTWKKVRDNWYRNKKQ